MIKQINKGIFPTMITPYKNGEIDYNAVEKLTNWYIENGCSGIFAVCQSSEMAYLSLDEKVTLAKAVMKAADSRINVVASGHTSTSFDEQYRELSMMAETGVDAVVTVSNRFDLHNDGDDVWLKNAEKMLNKLDDSITLGIYECPMPYKRLLSPRIIKWCMDTGRFTFIKDTCCSTEMLAERLEMIKNSSMMIFNANGQTFLYSLERGAAGYSGIMANYHPDLLCWLFENFDKDREKAYFISNALCMSAFTENNSYPCSAKYYLNKVGIEMDLFARSSNEKRMTGYQKLCMDKMFDFDNELRSIIGGKGI